MKIDLLEPFRRSENRRRPLLAYGGAIMILALWFPIILNFGKLIAGISFMAMILLWNVICKWRKWL
jgi:hypothetical protein